MLVIRGSLLTSSGEPVEGMGRGPVPRTNRLAYHLPVSDPGKPERAARNESIFRELNEHLDASADSVLDDAERAFVCECADISCAEVLTITPREYERIRRDAQRFVVAPSERHVDLTIERVVERHDGYWAVEKHGRAGDLAERLA